MYVAQSIIRLPEVSPGFMDLCKVFINDVPDGGEGHDLVHQAVEDLDLVIDAQLVDVLSGERLQDLGVLHPEGEPRVV